MSVEQPILDAEKLVTDLVTDYLNSRSLTGAAKIGAFFNLIGDLESVIPELSKIGDALKQLQISDVPSMLSQVVAALALTGKSALIAQAVLKLVGDASPVIADVEALILAIKG